MLFKIEVLNYNIYSDFNLFTIILICTFGEDQVYVFFFKYPKVNTLFTLISIAVPRVYCLFCLSTRVILIAIVELFIEFVSHFKNSLKKGIFS